MTARMRTSIYAAAAMAVAGGAVAMPAPAHGQWSTVYEQTYLPARHNWAFRKNYANADRLFNAFDYGHAILYETLYTRPDAPASLLEDGIYDRLTRRVLVRPPRLPLEEAAIEIEYAKLAPEAKMMFDWAHILHRQAYDVWADESIPVEAKDAHMAEVLDYYLSRRDLAFSTQPKSMDLMDGQYYSLAFRERFPKFNGLIWAYHWLQVGLYEPLIAGRDADERQAMVSATVARFWQMLETPPETMPYLMPMTAAVAPLFTERYPEIAIIFDNLHMMHDVVSDILASPEVPRNRKRAEIIRAVELFRDDTSFITSRDEWRRMAEGMGLENQGGPAVGFLPGLPTPTVPRGMSMAGMDHAAHGHEPAAQHPPAPAPRHEHAPAPAPAPQHEHPPAPAPAPQHEHPPAPAPAPQHEHPPAPAPAPAPPHPHAPAPAPAPQHQDEGGAGDHAGMHAAMELLARLLDDPQIEARIHASPELHRLWADPALQRQLEMIRRMHPPPAADR
ncbi:MAG TPA: hypothetical protein VK936_02745, partial [Longimicrobiales bacterium]|nr:hypothetical protein [Longimicrobiales bacterium]